MTFRFAAALLATLALAPAQAQEAAPKPDAAQPTQHWRHGLSLFGDVKYPIDFKHFDYVNPDAPKGGAAKFAAMGTFDSLNIFIRKGSPAFAVADVYDTLMTQSSDEPSSEYGLIAESVSYPVDSSSVTFRLRPEARWHDGTPITVEDVIWSFDTLKRINPQRQFYYRDVKSARKTGDHEVTFDFAGAGNRELPQIVGQLQVLPKAWWEGTDAAGKKRNVEEGTLEKPLGSGPYRVKDVSPGRWITMERVADYWAKDLPVRKGTNNFDELRTDYYREPVGQLEAFKKGDSDFRRENSAKNWATEYTFPAVKDNRVVLEKFPSKMSGIMQAFVFNLRRDKFKDQRVRRAFNLAFDFEEINKSLMFSAYVRIDSYFFPTELGSKGLPEGRELEILNEVKDKVPPEVFTTPYVNPIGGSPDAVRANLREAARLMKEAGWEIRDRKLVNAATGERMTVEFLYDSPMFERILLSYKPALERLGIEVTLRPVDDSQYTNRTRARDFDVIVGVYGQSLSPGNEQLEFWGSQSADRDGSQNLGGVKDPGVDALIEKVIYATNRDDLVAATRALDRVLLAHDYVVPHYASDAERTARWDRFSRPEKLPPAGSLFPDVWWWDDAKAKAAGGRS
ncbi:extracellular solute-binding protein [Methylopila sp. M107]|uniref:extracellular solute-binding protein n=1 Tax=Methylopila sp. M107 TaxID=1101190 RepID=UPI0003812F97|nr:extracellular solute-binding protein [Methylopila sp. M107]